jgi:hypothetical protein
MTLARASLRVGQYLTVKGIGGRWKIHHIDKPTIWVVPIDEIAQQFGRIGNGPVGFGVIDLARYPDPVTEELPL